jgi:hypothetical protein
MTTGFLYRKTRPDPRQSPFYSRNPRGDIRTRLRRFAQDNPSLEES